MESAQGQDLTLWCWLVDIFRNMQINLIGSFDCNYWGDAEDISHLLSFGKFCLPLPGKKIVCKISENCKGWQAAHLHWRKTFENLLHIASVRRTLSGILHFKHWMMIWLGTNDGARLEIISGEPSDTMTGQIHFRSVTHRFWPVKC